MDASRLLSPDALPIDEGLTRAMLVLLLVGVLLFAIVAVSDDRVATPDRADSTTIQVQWIAGDW